MQAMMITARVIMKMKNHGLSIVVTPERTAVSDLFFGL
jgi:hypothetical protein